MDAAGFRQIDPGVAVRTGGDAVDVHGGNIDDQIERSIEARAAALDAGEPERRALALGQRIFGEPVPGGNPVVRHFDEDGVEAVLMFDQRDDAVKIRRKECGPSVPA